ncbi:hypothetical protein LEP1GSC021_4069 [Leptospira noguchii str. 1993005606]|nr:hypothetical protein LEP1GSC021_4069 [Leptospira noguchii str. 1993005606]
MFHFYEKSWEFEFYRSIPKMWELLQIKILQTNCKSVYF